MLHVLPQGIKQSLPLGRMSTTVGGGGPCSYGALLAASLVAWFHLAFRRTRVVAFPSSIRCVPLTFGIDGPLLESFPVTD